MRACVVKPIFPAEPLARTRSKIGTEQAVAEGRYRLGVTPGAETPAELQLARAAAVAV